MGIKVAELFAVLGVKADTKALKQFDGALNGLKGSLLGAAALTGLASIGFVAMANNALNGALALSKFNAETGLSAQELQKWQAVAGAMNISGDEAASSIANLNKQLSLVRIGQGNIAPFQMLGIDVSQNAFGVMKQLRGSLSQFDTQTASSIIEQMGISPEMIKLLRMTNDEFEKLSKNAMILNPSQLATLEKAGSSLKQVGQMIQYYFASALVELTPIIVDLVEGFRNWAEVNNDKLVHGLKAFGLILGGLLKAIGNVFSAIDHIISGTIGWANALKILGAAAALVMIVLFPIQAAILAIILVIDDLMTYFQGGKSVIGDFFEAIAKNPYIKVIMDIFKVIGALMHGNLGEAWSGMKDIGTQVKTIASNPKSDQAGGANVSQENNTNIVVQGNGDPQDTAIATRKEVERSYNDASMQLNTSGY